MLFELLIFAVTTLLAYFYHKHKQVHRHFDLLGIRYLPGVPAVGNTLKSLLSIRHVLEDLEEVYKAFPNDKYVGYIENTKPVILIRDPELIKNVTVKDFDHFTDHPLIVDEELDTLFAGSLLLLKGEKWRHMRNTLSPAFTGSKMRHVMPCIVDITINIVNYLKECDGEDIDVDDLMHRYSNDVIALAAYGLKIDSLKDRDNQFYKIGSTLFNFDWKQKMKGFFMIQFPGLFKMLGMTFFPQSTHEFFKKIVQSTMEYRCNEHIERQDMIQLLMEAKEEWTLEELTAQVFIFFVAGFGTVASTLIMCIHELAINPIVQEKLYQEVKKHEEEKRLQFENISDLKYLDNVLNEALRKWSPALILDRVCVKSYEFPPPREGARPVMVKPGDTLFNMMNNIHMDEKHFPEPNVFDPDRFSEENKHDIKPFTFMPFGLGPRNCVGMRFALLEVKVLLYHLMLNFRIAKTAKTDDPIVLKPHFFNLRSVGGTWVRFEKR